MSNEKHKPIDNVRIGSVRAAIWKNDHEKGPIYNATFERSYRGSNKEWKSSSSFGRDELLLLAKVANEAHTRITALQKADREAQKHSGNGDDSEVTSDQRTTEETASNSNGAARATAKQRATKANAGR
jgi:Arc/MetJ-type ribon-helix-helix transcriptional regulator